MLIDFCLNFNNNKFKNKIIVLLKKVITDNFINCFQKHIADFD